ncbi:MAG TPA: hypothetical protein VEV20_06870 [Burkholderiales bacterium]|nr:hypothetical protein [Burkholderiales bacterium]
MRSSSFHNRIVCSAAAVALALSAGCGSKAPRGVAEVPECRRAATGVEKSPFDVGIQYLERQADAYSDCMTAHGYTLDQDQLDEDLKHFEQVQNAQWMGGDPQPLVAQKRQKMRMSPEFWRPAGSSS